MQGDKNRTCPLTERSLTNLNTAHNLSELPIRRFLFLLPLLLLLALLVAGLLVLASYLLLTERLENFETRTYRW